MSTYERISAASDEDVALAAEKGVWEVLATVSDKFFDDRPMVRMYLYYAGLFAAWRFHVVDPQSPRGPASQDSHHPRLLSAVEQAWKTAMARRAKEKTE